MSKPLIGISPLWDETKESLWMLPGYMNGIEEAGGIPVILPLSCDAAAIDQLAHTFDGFLFTGGHDISPDLYGEAKLATCGELCIKRDCMEQQLFQKAVVVLDKPVLGICRGLQLLNVLLGGTLYQDLPTQHPSAIAHQQQLPYATPTHFVSLLRDTPIQKNLGKEQLAVNSYHHQAIHVLADGLQPMAIAEDGLIESVYMPAKKYVQAVQWHPEFMGSERDSQRLFQEFVAACVQL
ncbi:MAG: gamma-glutamyl-gamma-aminobutyrate hydrolase family protein [Lachnospiraceae bacterium]